MKHWMNKPLARACALALLMAASACPAQAAASPDSARQNIAEIRTFDASSMARIKAAYAGRPFIVHFWGLTCGPCMAELPALARFARQHPDIPLVLVQSDEAPPQAASDALHSAGLAPTESWSVNGPMDEFLRATVDRKWVGDLPRTQLIDARGQVLTQRGALQFDAVRDWWKAQAPSESR